MFPPADQVFSAFELTPLDSIRVVILGQDPYHDDGQVEPTLAYNIFSRGDRFKNLSLSTFEPGSWLGILCVAWSQATSITSKHAERSSHGDQRKDSKAWMLEILGETGQYLVVSSVTNDIGVEMTVSNNLFLNW